MRPAPRTAKSALLTDRGLYVDGQPFPWHIDPDVVATWAHDEPKRLSIDLLVDGEVRFAPDAEAPSSAPVCVLATSARGGEEYAETLGLSDYRVVTPHRAHIAEGARYRGVVISPEFARRLYISADTAALDAPVWDAYRVAMRGAAGMGAPRG